MIPANNCIEEFILSPILQKSMCTNLPTLPLVFQKTKKTPIWPAFAI